MKYNFYVVKENGESLELPCPDRTTAAFLMAQILEKMCADMPQLTCGNSDIKEEKEYCSVELLLENKLFCKMGCYPISETTDGQTVH